MLAAGIMQVRRLGRVGKECFLFAASPQVVQKAPLGCGCGFRIFVLLLKKEGPNCSD